MNQHTVKFERRLSGARLIAEGDVSASSSSAEPTGNAGLGMDPAAEPPTPDPTPELLRQIADGISNIQTRTESVARELGSLSIALARVMVQKLVGYSEELQEKRLSGILMESLSRPQQAIGIYLNPKNLPAIESCLRQQESCQEIILSADASVAVGECRVEFDAHELVSSLENQLDEIEARLSEIIEDA